MRNVTPIRRSPAATTKILLGTRMQAESGVSHRKQRIGALSTRYAKRPTLASADAVPGSVSSASRDAVPGGLSLASPDVAPGTNPAGKRFLIETRSICCEHPDFSSWKGVHPNKLRPFQLVNPRGGADERSAGFCRLYLVRRSRTLSLSTFPSTVFPSRRARAALITAPICFSESAPASAMASSMAWWTS